MSTEPRASSTLRLSRVATKVRSKMVFVVLDSAVIVTAYFLSLVITLRDRAPVNYYNKLALFLVVALVVQLVANRSFGLYGRIWKYAGIDEARNIVAACLTRSSSCWSSIPSVSAST